uniref:Uncharacterized protein n=1 Tax=Anguilla anguilla TaxID=7936 RepID=A0A0E9SVF4_ANGAN
MGLDHIFDVLWCLQFTLHVKYNNRHFTLHVLFAYILTAIQQDGSDIIQYLV